MQEALRRTVSFRSCRIRSRSRTRRLRSAMRRLHASASARPSAAPTPYVLSITARRR